jgi:hypothetical protein
MVLRVKEPFSFDRDGVPVTMRHGDLVADDDPAVKGHEVHFEAAEDATTRTAPASVETASAVPGELRSVTRASRKQQNQQ